MTRRSVVLVLLFSLITFGIYGIYWYVATKDEMVSKGADIPTGWLIIIPIASIYWVWRWSAGVEHVSRGKMSGGVTFLLMFLLGWPIGMAILQATFNGIADEQARGNLPQARIA
jgi:hypothetical protein